MSWIPVGRAIFAVGVAAIGVQDLVLSDFVDGLQPVPAWLPARGLLASVTGLVLLGAGACLAAGRKVAAAGTVLAVFLGAWIGVVHVPGLIATPRDGGLWTSAFEILALAGAAWVLVAIVRPRWSATPGRVAFAVPLLAFGILHFIYHDYVASVIPDWIPAHQPWAYLTGVLHIAAGAAILAGVLARLAARLLGVMFGSWVLILHIPRATADVRSPPEWTSLFVAVAMCGASWIVAGSLAKAAPAASAHNPR